MTIGFCVKINHVSLVGRFQLSVILMAVVSRNACLSLRSFCIARLLAYPFNKMLGSGKLYKKPRFRKKTKSERKMLPWRKFRFRSRCCWSSATPGSPWRCTPRCRCSTSLSPPPSRRARRTSECCRTGWRKWLVEWRIGLSRLAWTSSKLIQISVLLLVQSCWWWWWSKCNHFLHSHRCCGLPD